jgi:MFS family permease
VQCGFAAAALLALVLFLQWQSGAYQNEFGGHPDEASHYVTGLMIRDYLAAGLPGNPMRFAQNYYEHYPKVALGHYPPAFYVLEGVWSLVFTESRTSILLFLALQTALLAFVLFRVLASRFGFPWAFGSAALLLAFPLVQHHTAIVMSDVTLSLFCILAALAFGRYLETGLTRNAVFFGLVASAAIMTKASGIALAVLPLLATLLARRFELMKRWPFWMPAAIVALICGPWMLFTYHLTAEGMQKQPVGSYILQSIPFYSRGLVYVAGFALLIPALIGSAGQLARMFKGRALEPFWAVMVSLPASVLVVAIVLPTGFDERYLLPTLPAFIALAVAGLHEIASLLAAKTGLKLATIQSGIAALMLGLFFVETFRIPKNTFRGVGALVETILATGGRGEILISSDSRGEGAFIAELAAHERRPGHTVRRASKVLASSTWVGGDYAPRFANEVELNRFLDSSPIEWIIVDGSIPNSLRLSHHGLLEAAAPSAPFLKLTGTYRIDRRNSSGQALLFRKSAGSAAQIQ